LRQAYSEIRDSSEGVSGEVERLELEVERLHNQLQRVSSTSLRQVPLLSPLSQSLRVGQAHSSDQNYFRLKGSCSPPVEVFSLPLIEIRRYVHPTPL
jgi:hypothetical protein